MKKRYYISRYYKGANKSVRDFYQHMLKGVDADMDTVSTPIVEEFGDGVSKITHEIIKTENPIKVFGGVDYRHIVIGLNGGIIYNFITYTGSIDSRHYQPMVNVKYSPDPDLFGYYKEYTQSVSDILKGTDKIAREQFDMSRATSKKKARMTTLMMLKRKSTPVYRA